MNLIRANAAAFNEHFNRRPLGIEHGLHELPLFGREKLERLVARYPAQDYFVAAGAPEPGTEFYGTPEVTLTPAEAFARLDQGHYRILLKRLEGNDEDFRELLAQLSAEVLALRPGLRDDRIARMESFIFISSAATITPFHFDPEVNFFFQVAGEKRYHLYEPVVLAETELERYYLRGKVNIGQVDLEKRKGQPESCFELRPGLGINHPANAPHWVETRAGLSISYSFCIETDSTRAAGRTRAFNALSRRMGINPTPPGVSPGADRVKAQCMQVVRPLITQAMAVRKWMA